MKLMFYSIIFLCFPNYYYALTLNGDNIKNHLGTRTPYRFQYNGNETNVIFPNCKDTKIWMMIRHGTRLPSAKDIQGMNTTLKALKDEIMAQFILGKGQLNKEEIERFKYWKGDIDVDLEKYLTLEGQEEMVLLAERMRKRFPHAIGTLYDNNTFHFQFTQTQRAQQSAKYFTIGLFENSNDVVFAPTIKIDPVLRFYKHCDRWQKQVKKNPSTYREQRLYGISKEMNDTLEKISKKLGLSNILSLDEVSLMYKICGFETSWNKYEDSPWCYVFDVEDAERLEYYYDLKHYWLDGYGDELTYRQACLSVKAMFDNFSTDKRPSSTFLFAHSGTLLKILAHLQLYRPNMHLRAENRQTSRSWRATVIDCFASNIAFVLYRCVDGDRVLTLHQERIIKLPMCKEDLCPMENLTKYFYDTINNCEMSDICSLYERDL